MVVPGHRIAISHIVTSVTDVTGTGLLCMYQTMKTHSVQSMILEGSIPFYNCNVMAHGLHNLLLIHNYVIRFPLSITY